MGGIGISLHSQEKGSAVSTPLTSIPRKVANYIASTLGIETAATKQALVSGKISLPEGVSVRITRKKTKERITVKKLPGGSQYEVTYKGKRTKITL
jgi:hypothetical protein